MKEIPKKIKQKLILMLLLTGLTGCKRREAQILIDGFQEAQAEVDAEEAGRETSESDSNKTNDDSDIGQKDGELEADEKKRERSEKVSNSSGEDVKAEEGAVMETQPEMIFVDVCGAVMNPGVFELEAGSRVFQAIEAAGGYLPEAAQTCINRAGVLVDGQQLYILTQEEMEQQGISPAEMANTSGNTGNLPDTQAGGSAGAAQPEASSGASGQQDNRVNINTADETQLTTLTGIGNTRAQAIIAYREENGPFAAIEEIMNVQGIKEGTFAKIKDEIVVE